MTKPISDFRLLLCLSLGLILSWAAVWSFSDRQELLALTAGYVLFTVNYLLLAKIYSTLLSVFQSSNGTARTRTLVTIGTGLKFFGLVGTLCLLLVYFALPALYLAAGSLISLFILTSLLVFGYVRTLNLSPRS